MHTKNTAVQTITKNVAVSLKAGPDDGLAEGQFTAYASVFGNVDSYGDIVVKGAFVDTLAEWAASDAVLPLLFGHNFSDPDYNIGSVLEAKEDDHGLFVLCELDMDSPKAAQVYRLIKGRRINQMSFAYDIEEASTEKLDDGSDRWVYELRKLKLHEVSVVPLGANQDTEILGVKAATATRVAELKAGRVISAKNEAEIQSAIDEITAAATRLQELLPVDDGEQNNDEGKASGTTPAKDEETPGSKSEEQASNPSVGALSVINAFELALSSNN